MTQTLFDLGTATEIHCFERAGLGKAPFRYVGMEDQTISYGRRVVGSVGGIDITTQPGTSCDYCGTYIRNIFVVESSDGRRFKVGCECIKKTGDEGLIRVVQRDVAKRNKAMRAARIAEKARKAEAYVRSFTRAELSRHPHPTPSYAAEGLTMDDYVQWWLPRSSFLSWENLAGQLKRVFG